jgi:hypothetical protein
MTFNVSPRETLQKADYSNNFQNHVEQARLRDATMSEARARDLEESQASKKEREIIERYLKGYFSDETLQLSALQIIGKLVFFLIVMPPVFIVLTLPKWLYQQIIEKGETLLDNVEKKAAAIIRPVINWVSIELNRLAEMVGMRGKQIGALFTKGGPLFSKLVERTLSRLQHGVQEVISTLKAPAAAILSFLQKIGHKTSEPFQEAYSAIKSFLTNIAARFTPSEKTALPAEEKKSMVEGAKEWLKDIGEKIAQIPSVFREDVREVMEGAKALATLAVSAAYTAAQIATNLIVPFTPTFSSPFLAASKEKLNLAAEVVKSLLHSAQMQIERFQGFLVLKYQEAHALFANLFAPLLARGKQFGGKALHQILSPMKKALREIRQQTLSFFALIRKRWQAYLISLKERAKKQGERALALFSSLKERSKKKAYEMVDSFKKSGRRALEIVVSIKEKGFFFLTQLLLAFSALFLIFRVFLKVAFQRAILLSKKI